MLTGIGIPSETMFGRENSDYIELVFQQNIQKMLVSYHSGMIGKNSYSLIFQDRKVFIGLLGTYNYLLLLCLTKESTA